MAISTRSTARGTAALLATLSVATLGAISCFSLVGCGDSGSDPVTAQQGKATNSSIPTASLNNPGGSGPNGTAAGNAVAGNSEPAEKTAQNQAAADPQAVPQQNSPEWLLGQLLVQRAEPASVERNRKLVAMSLELIEKTHQSKGLEPIFNRAVQTLCEARLDLAASGSADDIKALHDDAEEFYRRDPQSAAAEDAAWYLTRFAHTSARQGRNDPRKIQAFAIAARLFASRFPHSDSKALPLLHAAGQTCELYHLDSEAIECFAMLEEKFPKTPQAEQATAILRRLELRGKKVKLFGETSDGGFLQDGRLLGKPVLVVFWSSDSDAFQDMLPKLLKVTRQYERSGLTILGVCLDEDKAEMESFVAKNRLGWPQLFYADPDKRHWEHPLAQYYGVHDIPSLWLVDQEGNAVDTHVTPDSLDGQLRYLIATEGAPQRQ